MKDAFINQKDLPPKEGLLLQAFLNPKPFPYIIITKGNKQ
jgi:hypothetical protein